MTIAELLADPARWIKGDFARDEKGLAVPSCGDDAVSWCLSGALSRCYAHDPAQLNAAEERLLAALAEMEGKATDNVSFIKWQDRPERTHAEVLDLVRKAGV